VDDTLLNRYVGDGNPDDKVDKNTGKPVEADNVNADVSAI
jgi:hypothetical protein